MNGNRADDIDVDVLIPTNNGRLWNMLFQIRAALANDLRIRVTVACHQPWPELKAQLSVREMAKIRWVEDAPNGITGNPKDTPEGYQGSPSIKWCLENLKWADWVYQICDDDALLPWSINALFEARLEVAMVMGQVLPVSRKEHRDFTPYTIGRMLERCRVSNVGAMINMRCLETLPKPWYNERSGYADWELIEKMAIHFPYKIIKSVVHVLSLCEFDQLPEEIQPVVFNHMHTQGEAEWIKPN